MVSQIAGQARPGPLSGLLVADFARVLASPYCTMLLADLGADVIKVESPGGDDTRRWVPPTRDGVATYYLAINRNKRSMVLDLGDDKDLAAAHELTRRADIMVQNFKPGGLARFGLDYAAVQARNPAIVYASISGFGAGAGSALPGYDVLVQAVSGLMSLTVTRTARPTGPASRWSTSWPGCTPRWASWPRYSTGRRPGTASTSRSTCCPRRCPGWPTSPARTPRAAWCRCGWATCTPA